MCGAGHLALEAVQLEGDLVRGLGLVHNHRTPGVALGAVRLAGGEQLEPDVVRVDAALGQGVPAQLDELERAAQEPLVDVVGMDGGPQQGLQFLRVDPAAEQRGDALFTGENLHQIIAKQEAYKKGDFEQALKDGFLATDQAILKGQILS